MSTRIRYDQQRSRRVSASSSGNKQSLEELKGVTEREVADIVERAQPHRSPIGGRGDGKARRLPLVVGSCGGPFNQFLPFGAGHTLCAPARAIWRRLITSFGYSVGFLMVVLSRQQLFTENTVTVVLPVMKQLSFANLGRLGRLWCIVFDAKPSSRDAAAPIWC